MLDGEMNVWVGVEVSLKLEVVVELSGWVYCASEIIQVVR